MTFKETLVTVEMATKWLEGNVHNRILLQRVVDRYAASMSLGLWMLSPQCIVFDTTGMLIDGQHRLWAIVLVGQPQMCVVVTGADPKVQLVLDQNTPRNPADNVNLASRTGPVLSHDDLTVLRFVIHGYSAKRIPLPAEVVSEVWPQYAENVRAVKEACSGRTSVPTSAQFRGICSRALFTQNPDRVFRFCNIMLSGEVKSASERAAIRLRDMVMVDWRSGSARPTPMAKYLKTQSALMHFLSGTCPQKFRVHDRELFDIPKSSTLNRLSDRMKDFEARRTRTKNAQPVQPLLMAATPGELKVVDLLRRKGPMTRGEMAAAAGMTRGAIDALVTKLRKRNALTRGPGKIPKYGAGGADGAPAVA